ncbi:MAG: hypothetical protein WCJ84_02460 [Candidatus Peregrinibacteria bacterium]
MDEKFYQQFGIKREFKNPHGYHFPPPTETPKNTPKNDPKILPKSTIVTVDCKPTNENIENSSMKTKNEVFNRVSDTR